MKWHKLTKEEVLNNTETKEEGLTETQRQDRLHNLGENQLTQKAHEPTWKKIGKHFVDMLMIVLIIAGLLKGFVGDYIEMVIILAVVVINGLISYLQERKAEASLNGLKQLMSDEAVILTEGRRQTVANTSLVKGDIVILASGDVVPADLYLIETHQLLIEESALTGESMPVEKQVTVLGAETPLGDRVNMAFSGALVQTGTGVGIVVETGDKTQIGEINEALQTIEKQTTPLILKMNQLNHQIFKGLMGLIVFLLFFSSLRYGMNLHVLLSAVIALIVAVIPEGLPAVLTMILSMGVNEMAQEKAIVKSMPAVETLGAMTVICSDKTGTLTKNEMTVMDVVTNLGTQEKDALNQEILTIMNSCQELRLDATQKVTELAGDPTEMALLHYAEEAQATYLPIVAKIPFSSEYKYMATTHQTNGVHVLFVKGAPEVLYQKANISSEQKRYWTQEQTKLAKEGKRVLALARKNIQHSSNALNHEEVSGLELVALVGIIDPPKDSAIAAIKEAKTAGISVKMITGDHKDTAQAIGRQIGLAHTSNVLEGKEIDRLSQAQLEDHVHQVDIYARTTPEHKLRIVSALQSKGEIVGMTGDGVNDAPALKKADIGIAMGIKGSEVSKQAADMVLADDNFATITRAVKEGRRIFDNLTKTINFFLPTALAQGILVIFALLTNQPLPLSPVQILWVNMVTTITLSYALGYEPAHREIMSRPPRNPDAPILSGYSFFRIIYVSLLITVPAFLLTQTIENSDVQRTLLLQSLVVAQAVYMINCRELLERAFNKMIFKNKALWISLLALVLLQVFVITVPFMQTIIGTTSLSLGQHLMIGLNGVLVFSVVELEKFISLQITTRKKEATA